MKINAQKRRIRIAATGTGRKKINETFSAFPVIRQERVPHKSDERGNPPEKDTMRSLASCLAEAF